MKLLQTLVVRDEADVVEAQIAYHLNAGVDFVLATDHESRDGTTDILEAFAREGYLRRFAVSGPVRESEWRTRMARLAATEYGADWVINTDADEFWMPRGGTLKEVLAAVPERFGVVWALTRHFVPRPDDGAFFAERMTARVSAVAPINDPTSPYRPHSKAAHRADASILVWFGSHKVRTALQPLQDWYPADVLHFPFRSRAQYERKGVRRAHGDKPLGQYVKAFQARERGRVEDAYGAFLVDDGTLAKGRASGSLAIDTRLRDALRALRVEAGERSFRLPPGSELAANGATEADADVIPEGAGLREADLVRVCRSLDVLTARIGAVEERSWARGSRRLAGVGAR